MFARRQPAAASTSSALPPPARPVLSHHQSTGSSILSAHAARSLLDGLATPHASAYHYRPTPTRATTLPTGLGFHLDEPTSAVASLPPVGSAAARDLFSPSIYSTNSPDSSNLHPSPSTDSLPSPPSPGMDNLQVQEPLAWSDGPEWRDDVNYDSPVWTSRWGNRQDSTVSDSLWGTSGDGNGSAGSLAAPAGPVRRSSTGSTHGDTGGFLPVPLRRHNGGRLSDTSSNKSSLFRFSGIPFDPVTISDSTSSLEGDGWDDISNAISDEVHNNGVSGGFAFATHRSQSRVSDRSYDSAFQFDGPSRRPSTDSDFAHPPIMFGRQRAPLPSSFLPVPANAGAELLNRRGSTGGFSDYQIRRASYERRASGGHHPLVTSVDPLWTPEAEEHEPTFDRRESTGSEMERINKLNFLVELQRRASQVVQIGPAERLQAIDQWQADRDAVKSHWSPSTVASDESDFDDEEIPEPESHTSSSSDDEHSPTPNEGSPVSKYVTMHTNISLTFSFEERLSPFSSPIELAEETFAQPLALDSEDLTDLSPKPLIDTYVLAKSKSKSTLESPTKLLTAFSDEDSEGETDLGHAGTGDLLFGVEIATLRRVELRTASVTLSPRSSSPVMQSTALESAAPSPQPIESPSPELDYLADIVRIEPTPISSLNSTRRKSQPSAALLEAQRQQKQYDDFRAAFIKPPPATRVAAPPKTEKPLPPAPSVNRLRAVQSMSSIHQESPPPPRSKYDRMATFLSTSEGPPSESGSISPTTSRPRPSIEKQPSRARRQAGAWDHAWGAQLSRASICSSSGVDAVLPPALANTRRMSYVSQATPSNEVVSSSRRPSASSDLPFQEAFGKQSLARRRDSGVKLHLFSSDSPSTSTSFQPTLPPPPPPKAKVAKPVAVALPPALSPIAHRQPPSLPPTRTRPHVTLPQPLAMALAPLPAPAKADRTSRPDPILGPFARERTTIHSSSLARRRGGMDSPPVRFTVPRKEAPPRPVLEHHSTVVEQASSTRPKERTFELVAASPTFARPPPPAAVRLPPARTSTDKLKDAQGEGGLKKRRSRAVLSRLFTKRDKTSPSSSVF